MQMNDAQENNLKDLDDLIFAEEEHQASER